MGFGKFEEKKWEKKKHFNFVINIFLSIFLPEIQKEKNEIVYIFVETGNFAKFEIWRNFMFQKILKNNFFEFNLLHAIGTFQEKNLAKIEK